MSVRLSILATLALATLALGAAVAQGESRQTKPTLTVRGSQFGPVLFDGRNRALYAFTRDRRGGKSTCYGACAVAWPPYFASGRLRAGRGIKRSLLGTVRRRDGRRQITYRGWPLYYYEHDPVGKVLCQNVREFGGLWLVLRASGRLVR